MSAEQEALDQFGRLLINRVRDEAILDWDMILDGRMKSPHARKVRELVASLGTEQMQVLLRLVPRIVDTTLHHLLWTLEQTEWVDLAVRTDVSAVPRLQDATDSLCWELHGDEGWISTFSKQRYEEDL